MAAQIFDLQRLEKVLLSSRKYIIEISALTTRQCTITLNYLRKTEIHHHLEQRNKIVKPQKLCALDNIHIYHKIILTWHIT